MLLHLSIPGFHAAVHQAATSLLRDRPVAVAVDAGDQAPLFAVSLEGQAEGVWPGMRAAA
ncbi:MAG: DNA polymerase IV, partial [Planctomycetes bacterium]|nr:DNA polymerase IV [Planctomycetota bacterium]